MEAKDVPEVGGEGQLLVSEEATASGAVSIAPTDMTGNAVTLANESEQVCVLANVYVCVCSLTSVCVLATAHVC